MIQTNKINRIPLVVVGRDFWQPLIDWFRDTLLPQKLVSPGDMDLFQIADNAQEAYDAIVAVHAKTGINYSVRNDI